jgi:hypothetical protein
MTYMTLCIARPRLRVFLHGPSLPRRNNNMFYITRDIGTVPAQGILPDSKKVLMKVSEKE